MLQAVGPQTFAGLAAVAVGFVVQFEFLANFPQLMRIFVSGLICLVTYLAVAVGLFRVTAPLHLALSVLRDFRAVRLAGQFPTGSATLMRFSNDFFSSLTAEHGASFSRVVLGFLIPPVFRALSGGRDQVWISLALFAGLLIGLRVIPALLRAVLPFSAETRSIWFQRRQVAKLHDSYQWQKLFWIGLGLLAFAVAGDGLRTGEQVVTLVCLTGGGAGLLLWRRSKAAVKLA